MGDIRPIRIRSLSVGKNPLRVIGNFLLLILFLVVAMLTGVVPKEFSEGDATPRIIAAILIALAVVVATLIISKFVIDS